MPPSRPLNNTNVNDKDKRHHRTRSEITRTLLEQAQSKSTKFQRAPFDPNAAISHYEEEELHQYHHQSSHQTARTRVTPRRNYRGVMAENPSNYFDFPVPNWIQANPPPSSQRERLPRGITSALAQVQQHRHLGGDNSDNPLPVFPNLDVVRANSRENDQHQKYIDDASVIASSIKEPDFSFQVEREEKKPVVAALPQRELDFSTTSAYNNSNDANNTRNNSFHMNLIIECELRERRIIEEHSTLINQQVHHQFTEKRQEIQGKSLSASASKTARDKYDQALQKFVGDRIDLIGDVSSELSSILWNEFDVKNPGSLVSSLMAMNNDDDGGPQRNKSGKAGGGKKDDAAERTEIENRLAELETLLSWNKFERRRLEDLLRQETSDAMAAKATRDATMQQLAALEAECVPLLQGMQEIFGNDDATHGNNNNNQSMTSNNSVFGSFLNRQQGSSAADGRDATANKVKTALERIADQIEQSPLHKNKNSNYNQGTTNNGDDEASANDFQTLPPKEVLETLDRETLASMILLERQLSNRMLIGAKSQVFAEVEAQKRFVDTSILLKKQAAHSMFLADLFQHRLPQLRRACSALGNVVHKFEHSCSSSSVPRHKSNVVSRHNPGCSTVGSSGSSSSSTLTHSALVAYSKSLVAHVSSTLRWLDTEAGV